jgi:uncharacterized protein YecE (DUF72 family)
MTHDKWKGLGDWSLRIITWQKLGLPCFYHFNANAKGEENYIFFQVLIVLILGSL